MKMRITLLLLSLALVYAATAFAHGGKTHVMGTVSSVDAEHVAVKDREGKTLSIHLTKETKYQKSATPTVIGDLKVGDRVVVDATGSEDNLTAIEIRFGTAQESGHEQGARPNGSL